MSSNRRDATTGGEVNLRQLVTSRDWDAAMSRCESNPEEVKPLDPLTGTSILHILCYDSTSPLQLMSLVVSIFPEATAVQEKSYMATPLHVLCWSSQRSVAKVELLVRHMSSVGGDGLLLKNRMGGTALLSACGSNAALAVINLLVKANPSILNEKTRDGHTALTALWQSHLQSIPGHMAIARILKGEVVQENHFFRFYEKVMFLASEMCKIMPTCPPVSGNENAFHGLMQLRAPLNLLKVAIKLNPDICSFCDNDGNFPLHHVVRARPFRSKDAELIDALVKAFPEAANKRNTNGDTPLLMAIRDRMSWDEGIGSIAHADVESLSSVDIGTKLYPFLLAASVGGRVAVNTSFQLLCIKPHLVKDALLDSV